MFKTRSYPKWRYLIPIEITYQMYSDACITLFEYPAEDCKINLSGGGASIKTPTGQIYHGGFGENTDKPELSNRSELYYSGSGCTWSTDENGEVYRLLGNNNLPYEWHKVLAMEIIYKYKTEYIKYQRLEKLKKIEKYEQNNN